jgi:capsular polysaccharide biosynthesis protein
MKTITLTEIVRRWRVITTTMVICALVAFIISVMLPAKYQSDIKMIVVQKQVDEKVDAFSATKSAEFLSNIFANAIYTTSFFNGVQDAPFDVRREFSTDPEKRKKEWKKFIDVKKVNNTGILMISVYDPSRATAEETAKAIAYMLTTHSEEYHGGGERVEVRLIDGPNTPLRPTVPRIGLNTVIGGFMGVAIAIAFVIFFPTVRFMHKQDEFYQDDSISTREKSDGGEDMQDVVTDHFHNNRVQNATITYDDPEVNALHERISRFHQSN